MYYTVENIIGKKLIHGQVWYKVKWLGYTESQSTWQPPYTLQFAKQLVCDYEEAHGNQLDSDIFENRDYGVSDNDFFQSESQKVTCNLKNKTGTAEESAEIMQPIEDIDNVKRQFCKVEQSSNYDGNHYNQSHSSYSCNKISQHSFSQSYAITIENQIKILSRKRGRPSENNNTYLVELGSKEITEMSNHELLRKYPVQFAKFLEETLYRKTERALISS